MYCCLQTCSLLGLSGNLIDVEADLTNGLPKFTIVGLPDAAIKESIERVRSGIKNSGYEFPLKRITINLAPANIRKDGSQIDLPIAIAILIANETIELKEDDYIYLGELSLDGGLNAINGALAMIISLREKGYRKFIVPDENKLECGLINDVEIYPAKNLRQVVNHITGEEKIDRFIGEYSIKDESFPYDYSDIKGQSYMKRALQVSAAGKHNVLMIGSPGSGKSMAAKRYPTILPRLNYEEAIQVTKIYSVAGLLDDNKLISYAPFRSPHHTSSAVSIIGGGVNPKPGEVTLSHNGVLFLDEIFEFPKSVLEVLRQPIEDKEINIARANSRVSYPSDFILIAAGNPCPCGLKGSDLDHECTCTPYEIKRYLSRVSEPLLDRIDIHIRINPVKYENLANEATTESSKELAEKVNIARQIQLDRYKGSGIFYNSNLTQKQIHHYCKLDKECKNLMEFAFKKYRFSARAYNKIIKLARTIADLRESKEIEKDDLLEAIRYRSLNMS